MSKKLDDSRLWAKRWQGDGPEESAYLPGHLRDVYDAAQHVLDTTGDSQLAALGLPPSEWLTRFRRVVSVGAAVHDLGKCNSQFQGMLKNNDRQALRHEWVTLLILNSAEWRSWLLPAVGSDNTDWDILCWSIAGHHPRYDRSAPPELREGPITMRIALDHNDMDAVVKWLQTVFGLKGLPELHPRTINLSTGGDDSLDKLYQRYYDDEDRYDSFPVPVRRLIAAVKDCLVAADVAGSALPRDVKDRLQRSQWIRTVLNAETLPRAADYRQIAAKRLNCQASEVDDKLRRFQRNGADRARRVTLVLAGCGTGKTLLVYRWAEVSCPGRRLFVCYPTTGTATEGFRDYLLDPSLSEYVKTNLEQSRRSVDFKLLLRADEDRNTDIARIESLDLWRIPVVACTVDSVLGIVQNNRRGLFAWPAIAQGGFVFDEIHSYDDKLFDALLHFLDAVRGVPVLLMTASLPEHRRAAIEQVLRKNQERFVTVPGPRNIEKRDRYIREDVSTKELAARVEKENNSGGKVLRVCNTVDAAMREAAVLEEMGLAPLLYHSRFRYIDRVKRHQAVIDAFDRKKNLGAALAVCTQVAEMSLDLSASLLVTDLAPVPSLIQRLGRLNRHAKSDDPSRPFIVTDPLGADGKFSPLPYDADDLETARRWLDELGSGRISQSDLAKAWDGLQDSAADVPRYLSAWLDFGPATPVLELRDGAPNITVVLHEDWAKLKDEETTLAEVALPMPVPPVKRAGKPFDWQDDEFNGVPVARKDAISYDRERGAQWAR